MAARVTAFLKDAWAKEPGPVVSFAIGGSALTMPVLSPYSKYSVMMNKATPYIPRPQLGVDVE
jgi:NADH dehydrogenase (ubiquinone) 1 alpha subcomplex subunit 3